MFLLIINQLGLSTLQKLASKPFGKVAHIGLVFNQQYRVSVGTSLTTMLPLSKDKQRESKNSKFMGENWKLENFEILEYVSKGRFGSVWKANYKANNQAYALKKVITKEFILKNRQYQNLKREVEIQNKLNHKHIVKLYGYFTDEFFVYIVLEYCANLSLYQLFKSHEMNEIQIARLFLQIVSAVEYLHKRNIIHRDIKLENIVLDQNLNAKIADFGYAVQTLGPRDSFCGTLSYMTKEQIQQQQYGKEVDIWKLGIILYEMSFKASPFSTDDRAEVIKSIKENHIIIPAHKYSNYLDDLILRLLDPEPTSRITIGEVIEHQWIVEMVKKGLNQ